MIDLGKLLLTLGLFICTAVAEILGCYFPYLVLRANKTAWLYLPTLLCLVVFVWLLSLHPTATGRVYAAYGGVYIAVALLWLRYVDRVHLSVWDVGGGCVVLLGAALIILQPQAFVR
jgi:small multidrug resistance family-3 protein